jgi:hypothetical protein
VPPMIPKPRMLGISNAIRCIEMGLPNTAAWAWRISTPIPATAPARPAAIGKRTARDRACCDLPFWSP